MRNQRENYFLYFYYFLFLSAFWNQALPENALNTAAKMMHENS